MSDMFDTEEMLGDYWAPTLANQLREARKLSPDECYRHAAVSINNSCECGTCFCCACAQVYREREKHGTFWVAT